MSFEGDKARLVQELADMQKLIRAEYDVAPRSDPPAAAEPAKASPALAKRLAVISD